jgi:hypothetical protein
MEPRSPGAQRCNFTHRLVAQHKRERPADRSRVDSIVSAAYSCLSKAHQDFVRSRLRGRDVRDFDLSGGNENRRLHRPLSFVGLTFAVDENQGIFGLAPETPLDLLGA